MRRLRANIKLFVWPTKPATCMLLYAHALSCDHLSSLIVVCCSCDSFRALLLHLLYASAGRGTLAVASAPRAGPPASPSRGPSAIAPLAGSVTSTGQGGTAWRGAGRSAASASRRRGLGRSWAQPSGSRQAKVIPGAEEAWIADAAARLGQRSRAPGLGPDRQARAWRTAILARASTLSGGARHRRATQHMPGPGPAAPRPAARGAAPGTRAATSPVAMRADRGEAAAGQAWARRRGRGHPHLGVRLGSWRASRVSGCHGAGCRGTTSDARAAPRCRRRRSARRPASAPA